MRLQDQPRHPNPRSAARFHPKLGYGNLRCSVLLVVIQRHLVSQAPREHRHRQHRNPQHVRLEHLPPPRTPTPRRLVHLRNTPMRWIGLNCDWVPGWQCLRFFLPADSSIWTVRLGPCAKRCKAARSIFCSLIRNGTAAPASAPSLTPPGSLCSDQPDPRRKRPPLRLGKRPILWRVHIVVYHQRIQAAGRILDDPAQSEI